MRSLINLIILLLFCSQYAVTQEFNEYTVVINDEDYIPKYDNNDNVCLINNKLKGANDINQIFRSLDMRDCVYVNEIIPNQNDMTILISIYNMDTVAVQALMDQLINNHTSYISYERIPTGIPLYTPDDFENAVGLPTKLTYTAQDDLRMMRAQEAWDITKGDPNVLIGISDTGFDANHPDLASEIAGGIGNYNNSAGHGTAVFGYATGATDNGAGSISSIGFNTRALLRAGLSTQGLEQLSFLGAKVVNGSFYDSTPTNSPSVVINSTHGIDSQNRIDNMINNGTVVVVAAGNGPHTGDSDDTDGVLTNESYASRYYFPASYRDVISVSTVGNVNEINFDEDGDVLTYDNWKDIHLTKALDDRYFSGTNPQVLVNSLLKNYSNQHNDSVDIVVAAYRASPKVFRVGGNINDLYRDGGPGSGTSYSAPQVAGVVGLMFSVNFCLDPKEVESILKLTAVKIDTLPLNLPFYGRLGAGRLDAYEAVKMANDMALPFGIVEVKDRILYRPWFYKLETAPYEIKMINNDVSLGAKLKFRARNNIEILSGDYYPSTGGYIDLQIDETLVLDDCPPPVSFSSQSSNGNVKGIESNYVIFPTLIENDVSIEQKIKEIENVTSIRIFNFFGEEVYRKEKIDANQITLNLSGLFEGIYILKIYNTNGEVLHTQKIVKK